MRRAAAVLWLTVAGAVPLASPAVAREVAFVHLEGNVGVASGGHAALRIGDVAYNYQLHPDGVLRLLREPWAFFEYRYALLQNRPIRVAALRLEETEVRRVADAFAREHVLQARRLDEAARRGRERELAEAWATPHPSLRIPRAGLFDAEAVGDPVALALRARVEAALGAGVLAARLASADASLRRATGAGDLAGAVAALEERTALADLHLARPLAAGALVDPALAWDAAPAGLGGLERAALEAHAEAQAHAVVELIGSPRPDRAAALMLASARHQAAVRSLREDRALWLDAMPDHAPTLDAAQAARRADELRGLVHRHGVAYERARRELRASGRLGEVDVARMEDLASRGREYARGAEGHPVREPPQRPLPSRARSVPAPVPDAQLGVRRARAEAARGAEAALLAELRERYDYQLVRHNCATELVRTLGAALGGPDAAAVALGGRLAPGEGGSFVPWRLFDLVVARLDVDRVERVPGWRERALAGLRTRGDSPALRLREANTLTSRVYTHRHRDSSFLLFTDDVFWRRPLYGAANLAWALGDGALGVLTAPFDRGRRLVGAGYGAFYSVPELVFANIRKGSFDARSLPVAPPPADAP